MKRYINPVPQYFDNEGNVLSGGLVNFYENGSTTTRKATYNADGGSQNLNPVTLSDQGRLPSVFGDGLYTIVITDASGTQSWVRHGVDFGSSEGQFSDWVAVKPYSIKEIVRFTDGNYYISESNINIGNPPADDSVSWSQILFVEYFNPNKLGGYPEDAAVVDGGFIYRSLQDNNEDTPPSAKWANLTFNDSIAGDFSVGGSLDVGVDTEIVGALEAGGSVKFTAGKIQIGADAGTKRFIRFDGKISSDDVTYYDIATSQDNQPEIAATLLNSYANYSGGLYAKVVQDVLYIYGSVTSPSVIVGATPYNPIMTLPVGYRPSAERTCTAMQRVFDVPVTRELSFIRITTAGSVEWNTPIEDYIVSFAIAVPL